MHHRSYSVPSQEKETSLAVKKMVRGLSDKENGALRSTCA
jgi:hypothetical protein